MATTVQRSPSDQTIPISTATTAKIRGILGDVAESVTPQLEKIVAEYRDRDHRLRAETDRGARRTKLENQQLTAALS
jgi:hypothetical protein